MIYKDGTVSSSLLHTTDKVTGNASFKNDVVSISLHICACIGRSADIESKIDYFLQANVQEGRRLLAEEMEGEVAPSSASEADSHFSEQLSSVDTPIRCENDVVADSILNGFEADHPKS